jgi:hypothetical protein
LQCAPQAEPLPVSLDVLRLSRVHRCNVRKPGMKRLIGIAIFSVFAIFVSVSPARRICFGRIARTIRQRCGSENEPQTVLFYAAKLSRLLEYAPIAGARLDPDRRRCHRGLCCSPPRLRRPCNSQSGTCHPSQDATPCPRVERDRARATNPAPIGRTDPGFRALTQTGENLSRGFQPATPGHRHLDA